MVLIKNTKLFLIFSVVFIFIVAGLSIYFYQHFSVDRVSDTEASVKKIDDTITRVSKLLVLPTDERPTIATVSDPQKLKDQVFFANAKVGDQVLIYTKNKKVILYDPIANRIVEIASLNTGATLPKNK